MQPAWSVSANWFRYVAYSSRKMLRSGWSYGKTIYVMYKPDVSSIALKNARSGTGLTIRRSVSPTL